LRIGQRWTKSVRLNEGERVHAKTTSHFWRSDLGFVVMTKLHGKRTPTLGYRPERSRIPEHL